MPPEPEEFIASLSAAELHKLRATAAASRELLTARFKELGFGKLGHRLKLEQLLKPEASGSSDDGAAAAPAAPAAPPAEVDPSFSPSARFAGARAGFVFKRDRKGVGYYVDNPPKPTFQTPEMKEKKKFKGNLTWLNEAPEERDLSLLEPPEEKEEEVVKPPPEVVKYDAYNNPLLTSEQRAKYEARAGPYNPELKEGKYAEEKDTVRVELHKWPPVWGEVESIKMNNFKVRCHDANTDRTGVVDPYGRVVESRHDELKTTGLRLKYFLKLKAAHDVRRPAAQKVLATGRAPFVNKEFQLEMAKAFGGYLKGPTAVPPAPAVASQNDVSRSQAGSGSGYYYAAVTEDKRTMEAAAPTRIDAAEVKPIPAKGDPTGGVEAAEGGEPAKSNYYYAHRRKVDYNIPTPTPKRIDVD